MATTNPRETKYVEWFVNREKQRIGFLNMISGEATKQIMVIKAPTAMGKTWLIQHLYHDSRSRGIPVAVIDFTRRQPWDYLTIVRHAREEFGPAYFNHMTLVINEVTQLRVEDVDITLEITDSNITDSNITVGGEMRLATDNFDSVDVQSDVVRRNLEMRITEAFMSCLQALAQEQKVVFLFDSTELAPATATEWIVNQLLWRIRDGDLPNVLVIIAGQTVPMLDASWNDFVGRTGLDMFKDEHIEEFIVKRGIHRHLNISAEDMMSLSRGHPGLLGQMADNVLKEELQDDDEVWMNAP